MTNRISPGLPLWKRLVLAAGIGIIPGQSHAQSQSLRFEVASIKPADPSNQRGGIRRAPAEVLNATNVSAGALILYAYGIRDFQLSGVPGWLTSELYDIAASPSNS